MLNILGKSINYGIKTGYNDAFIIDNETKEALVKEDPKSAEIIKPVLRGRNIKRYQARWQNSWLITTAPSLNINVEKYPAIKNHLLTFGQTRLEQAGKILPDKRKSRKKTNHAWFELQDTCAYLAEFEKEKIVWQRVTKEPIFCNVKGGIYIQDSMAFFTCHQNANFLIAILNSKLIRWFIEAFVHRYGNSGFLLANQYVEKIPIPNPSIQQQQHLNKLVNKIIDSKKSKIETKNLETQINFIVYKIYELTSNEIKMIEQHH